MQQQQREEFVVSPIGHVRTEGGFRVELSPERRELWTGLRGLDGFGHVLVLWIANKPAADERPEVLISKPYIGGPDQIGVFATRSPLHPNAINVSVGIVTHVDETRGVLHLAWIDAEDGTPVVDIKPYHPSSDRVEHPRVPGWCSHWPKSLEGSGEFDWSTVFSHQ